ncbi:MAG TPA: hypothetical protein VK106_05815, partial [Balneolaceae bacterium]|nr:hypothetical protein [Balneolaceae bacterium]
MKKLIMLTFALLFTAGMAFGQNNASTSQNGSGNQAKIGQVNSGNDATITQDGNNHYAHVNQTFIAGTGYGINEADIIQRGTKPDRLENWSDYLGAQQTGAGNSFKLLQANGGNIVYDITQGTEDNPSWGGIINIEQSTNTIQQPNDGEVPDLSVSSFYNRVAHASQFGYGNELYVYQRDQNRAYIEAQVNNFGDVNDGNVIDIDQLGAESWVGQQFTNQTSRQSYGAYQEGTSNV